MSRLFAFIDIFVEASEMDNVVEALSKLKNLEELYEVTGEFDIVTLGFSGRHRRIQGCFKKPDHEDKRRKEHR